MILSKWLTRNEWNAAYFTYYFCQSVSKESNEHDLGLMLRHGICVLDKFGYKNWMGIIVPNNNDLFSINKNTNSKYKENTCTKDGYNAACLVELMTDELNYIERLNETILWIKSLSYLDSKFKFLFVEFCEKLIIKIKALQKH